LRGDVLVYVAQGNPLIDAKIAEKRRFQTGTSPSPPGVSGQEADHQLFFGLGPDRVPRSGASGKPAGAAAAARDRTIVIASVGTGKNRQDAVDV